MLADGENLTIETNVTGTVSLDADKVSICRESFVFFTNTKRTFSPELFSTILKEYKSD